MSRIEIHTLGVAQGDSQIIAIKDDDGFCTSLILIDVGKKAQGEKVFNFVNGRFIGKDKQEAPVFKLIDHLIITHWDTDHFGGILHLNELMDVHCKCYTASTPSDSQAFREIALYLKQKFGSNYLDIKLLPNKCIVLPPDVQIRFVIADQVIFTSDREKDSSPTNKSSIGLFVELYDPVSQKLIFRYFTAGDLDFENEDKIIDKYKSRDFIIHSAKLSHHGARNSTSVKFIQESGMKLGIASFAKGNKYDHPSKDVIDDLKDNNVQVLMTNPIEYKHPSLFKNNQENVAFVGNDVIGSNNIVQTIYSSLDRSTNVISYHWVTNFLISNCQLSNFGTQTCPDDNCLKCYNEPNHKILQSRILPPRLKSPISLRNHRRNITSTDNTSIIGFISDITDNQFTDYFPKEIDNLIGNLPIHIETKQTSPNTTEYEILLEKKLVIFDGLSIEKPSINIRKDIAKIGNDTSIFLRVRLSSVVNIGKVSANIYVDFSSGNTWEFTAEPKNSNKEELSFADIASVLPGFDPNLVSTWSDKLGLKNLKIRSLKFGISLSTSSFNFEYLLVDFRLSLFKDFDLILVARYAKSSGISISGKLEKEIKLHCLLSGLGLSQSNVDHFPDLLIDDFGFSANPKNDAYGIYASCSDIDLEFNILKTDIQLSSIGFEIEKSKDHLIIKVDIGGYIGDSYISISGTYSKLEGFIFNGNISEINPNSILSGFGVNLPEAINIPVFKDVELCNKPLLLKATTVASYGFDICGVGFAFGINGFLYSNANYSLNGEITLFDIKSEFTSTNESFDIAIYDLNFGKTLQKVGVSQEVANYFNLDFKETHIKVSKNKFEFETTLENFSLVQGLNLTENKVGFLISKPEQKIYVSTTLNIQYDVNKKIICEGGLSISNEGFTFYAKSHSEFVNVFNIKDFNFGAVYVAINSTPAGVGIGLKGDLRFKKFSGQIAVYYSPVRPDEKLLAVNLNSLTLKDIVECIVDSPNSGDVLGEIGIKPIVLPVEVERPELNDEVKNAIKVIDNNSSGNLTMSASADDGYSWLPDNSYLIEDKATFKSYMFTKKPSGKYRLEKWISLYGCTSPTNITLDGCEFEPGFAFSGELTFLNVKQIINFSAMPKSGLQVYAELVKSINIADGAILLSRVEDLSKGPILSLSTYTDKQHFYLSANLKILSIINYKALISFERDQFAFALSSDVLGFRTSIQAAGVYKDFQNAKFAMAFLFETNGFSSITDDISKKLHGIADDINARGKDASSKLAGAQRTVDEYLANLRDVDRDIESNKRQLSELTSTSYPWYEAYMYPVLAGKISFVSAKIAGLYTYQGSLYALSKAADGVLTVMRLLVENVTEVSSSVIKGVANITIVLGKGIDWIIKINRIYAAFELGGTSQSFDFELDFVLCGDNHNRTINLKVDGSLSDLIRNEIDKLIHTPEPEKLQLSLLGRRQVVSKLDNVYGKLDRKDVRYVRKHFQKEHSLKFRGNMKGEHFNLDPLLNDLASDMQLIGEVFKSQENNSYFTNRVDQSNMQKLKDLASEYSIDKRNHLNHFSKTGVSSLKSLQDCNQEMQTIIDSKLDKVNHGDIIDKAEKIDGLLSDLAASLNVTLGETSQNVYDSSELLDALGEFGTSVNTQENVLKFNDEETLTDDQKLDIISSFESLTSETSELSPYMKSVFFMNLGRAYKELGNEAESLKNFHSSIDINIDIFGKDSEQVRSIQNIMKEKS